MKNYLINELSERIMVLDGAMGTMIQSYRLQEEDYRGDAFKNFAHDLKGNNDLLNLTQPELIKEIHLAYLKAGADFIETNSFNANAISLADYHLAHLAYDINFQAAAIAKEVAEKISKESGQRRFVIGILGPTNRTASISPDVNDPSFRNITFDILVKTYLEALHGLVAGGSDLIMVETIFDTLNAKAALFAIDTYFKNQKTSLPIMISGTITDASGRTLSGQTTEAFWHSVSHANPFYVGFNCALGPKALRPYLQGGCNFSMMQVTLRVMNKLLVLIRIIDWVQI